MSSATRYWRMVRLDGTGKRRVEDLVNARSFFQQQFPNFDSQTEVPDKPIQATLWNLGQDESQPQDVRDLAALCLRCFISDQIDHVCRQLAHQFGTHHGFNDDDLLPLVLNDDGKQRPVDSPWRSLASEILRTFDPNRAGLSTWVNRQVRHSRDLHQFLLEHGVYLISDWAILNDTTLKQLRRILSEFYTLTLAEVEPACRLLEAYHQIYRHNRIKDIMAGKHQTQKACKPPTLEQLADIAAYLGNPQPSTLVCQNLMLQLQTMATQLRQYRIAMRIKRPRIEPLEEQLDNYEAIDPSSEPDEQDEFLSFYRQQFTVCLDEALKQVTQDRITYLNHRKPANANAFRTALTLFHCQGKPMGEIASQIGLQAQFQVTRLMKLKEFRTDVQQRWQQKLSHRILQQIRHYPTANRQKVQVALDEQIACEIQRATAEAAIAKSHPLTSLFARRLCHYLD